MNKFVTLNPSSDKNIRSTQEEPNHPIMTEQTNESFIISESIQQYNLNFSITDDSSEHYQRKKHAKPHHHITLSSESE